ncbi:hypothetical protein BDK51DRAFT_25741 [Blyttiomyces helicus]|uniref:Uncharacterized protein n=1 Tax=Blyttiomyces helicus TaxID=388810 RepID=A0A4P9W905_9FUNG|nr:hypothetical protein BDK51DRAFT_25741 [Blyttiomyces helicus]|eukprot:RKO88864.1 hypothetical protein BDK51DRAFT_25741 [Blyttiomyces helicus]
MVLEQEIISVDASADEILADTRQTRTGSLWPSVTELQRLRDAQAMVVQNLIAEIDTHMKVVQDHFAEREAHAMAVEDILAERAAHAGVVADLAAEREAHTVIVWERLVERNAMIAEEDAERAYKEKAQEVLVQKMEKQELEGRWVSWLAPFRVVKKKEAAEKEYVIRPSTCTCMGPTWFLKQDSYPVLGSVGMMRMVSRMLMN